MARYISRRNGRRERRYRSVVQRETTSDKLEIRFTVSTSLPPIEFLRMRFASSLGGPLDDATTQRRNDATPCQRHPTPRRATSVRSPTLACLLSVADTVRIVPPYVIENLKRKLTIRGMRKSWSELYRIPGFPSKLSQVRSLSISIPT